MVAQDAQVDESLDGGLNFSAEAQEVIAAAVIRNTGYSCKRRNCLKASVLLIEKYHLQDLESNLSCFMISYLDTVSSKSSSGLTMGGAGLTSDYSFAVLSFHWGTRTDPGSQHLLNGQRMMAEVRLELHFAIVSFVIACH